VRVVVDTNVLISGIFFTGAPHQILRACMSDKIDLVVSPEILVEYRRVAEELAARFPGVEASRLLDLVTVKSLICDAEPLPESVCDDPDDDKFLACALGSGARIVVTGDKALLRVDGFQGLAILRPRRFVDNHLAG
jgi:putative PIN family toxin of toxin-antitoxin system